MRSGFEVSCTLTNGGQDNMTTYIGRVRKLLPKGEIDVRLAGAKGLCNLFPLSRRTFGVIQGDGGILLSVNDTKPSKPVRRPKVGDLILVTVEGIVAETWALLPKDASTQERFWPE